jgi:hypothetical protein
VNQITAKPRGSLHPPRLPTHDTQLVTVRRDVTGKKLEMNSWEMIPIVAALLLATAAAVASSGPEVPRDMTNYLAAALAPQPADNGEIIN